MTAQDTVNDDGRAPAWRKELRPTETGHVVAVEYDGGRAGITLDGAVVAHIDYCGLGTFRRKTVAYAAALRIHLALGNAYRRRRNRKARIAAQLKGGAR